jgi:dihydroxy-acid dehydratase
VENRIIDLEVDKETLAKRAAQWKAPAPKYKTGVFAKYRANVSSAAQGAVTGTFPELARQLT